MGAADASSTTLGELDLPKRRHRLALSPGQPTGNTHVVFYDLEVGFLLLPKEIDAEILHERRELIHDVLQGFRAFPQCLEELSIGLQDLGWHEGVQHALSDQS